MKLTNKGKFFVQCPVPFDLLKKNKLAQRAMKAAEEGEAAQGRPLNWKVRRGGSETARGQGSVSGTKDRVTFINFNSGCLASYLRRSTHGPCSNTE